ncbi:MAG: M56 family metallopeptidase [Parachlamydiaceae bacterium]|nr:M56 family metallopeptidase [Parachlamydiaceae bacterium]
MISNPLFLISVLSSSLLAFFTMAFAVEIFQKIFVIKQHRIRSTLRLLPFLSLMVDILFNRYSLSNWINPLSCTSCVQKLILEFLFPNLKEHLIENDLSLIRYLGGEYQHGFYAIIFMSFIFVSILFAARKLVQAYFLSHSIKSIVKNSLPCDFQILNSHLLKKLQTSQASIYFSDEIQIPLAAYGKVIIIPTKASSILSQQEFEAVIAHELEHINYQDPLARLLYQLMATLCWWIPTASWIKKIEQEQELACDQNAVKYGLQPESIASALVKVAKHTKTHQSLCYFTTPANPTVARIHAVLGIPCVEDKNILSFNLFGLSLGFLLLMACLAWA